MSCKTIVMERGARFGLPFELRVSDATFDWTGMTVRIRLKETADGPDICTMDSVSGDPSTSLIYSIPQLGVLQGTAIAEGSVTELWPDSLVGDIRVYRASPLFGPYMAGRFAVEVRQSPNT